LSQMPLEYVCKTILQSEDGRRLQEVCVDDGLVESSDAAFIACYPEGGGDEPEEIAIIVCNEDGDGGNVYFVEAEGEFAAEDLSHLTEDDLPEDAETYEIDEHGVFEAEISLQDGTEVTFEIERVPSNKITQYFNIPRALASPN